MGKRMILRLNEGPNGENWKRTRHPLQLLLVFYLATAICWLGPSQDGKSFAHAQLPGSWQIVVQSAGIASMHTTVTSYGQVLLLDRTDIGTSEIDLPAGQCRNDPTDISLVHDCTAHSVLYNLEGDPFSGLLRPLTILTDTWCSSGQFDGNGTLVQTGGFDDGSTKVRYYSPCPPGGRCDWVEATDVALQQARWYATNQLLPDGRQIIVGGRDAHNVEFIPDQGEGLVSLSLLEETTDAQEDNLYPYVHLLPSGFLFIFANRASIIYDYKNAKVVQSFPLIPGEPRNYPSAGSSVLLPLLAANNFATVDILVCGGAQYGAFLNQSRLPASNTCGRLRVSDPNPDWVMETMPLRRCMGDMVLLPSRDVLIINGAATGSQGWGNADDPVLNPLLYKPAAPIGVRFTLLSPSTIPRMYHSTANLLPDGRVLVAGSNPHQFYTFIDKYPTELRVEAFSPAYLAPQLATLAPAIISVPTNFTYNQTFSIQVYLTGPVLASIDLNLVNSPFVTHSFAHGQRLLALLASPPIFQGNFTYLISGTAPPSPLLAPPSYYMLFAVNQGIPSAGAWILLSS